MSDLKDLRGCDNRSVHVDDDVIITGPEYLRKSRLANENGQLQQRIKDLEREVDEWRSMMRTGERPR
jgi:hypothetical protein